MKLKMIKYFDLYSKYKIYFQSSFLYFASTAFSAVISILVNPFMAKNLSPEDYAVMGYFNSFTIIILPIMNFSLITYYLRHYYKIPDDRKQIVSDTILIALLFFGLVILTISYLIFYIYSMYTKLSFPIYPFALLAFIPVYLGNFVTLYLVKCRLKREAIKYTRLTIVSSVFSILLGILFVITFKYGATGRMGATAIVSLLTAIYCFKKMFGKFQFDIEVLKDAFRFGWPLSLSAILWYFLSGIDIALLEKLNDTYTLGFYNVGIQIAGYFAIFYTAISQTFEPDIYKAITDGKKRKLLKIIFGIITLNAIPNIVFILLAPAIIGLLTYNTYTDASGFAQILALKNITISIYYCLITIVVGYGFTKSLLVMIILGSIMSTLTFKLLITNYGFYGAAWGQVISFVIMAVISVSFLLFMLMRRKRLYDLV